MYIERRSRHSGLRSRGLGLQTSDSWLLVLLEVVVDEAEDEGRLAWLAACSHAEYNTVWSHLSNSSLTKQNQLDTAAWLRCCIVIGHCLCLCFV